jgi:SAM-dependent methyltransferase
MLRTLASLPRRLRWRLHRWSPAADREFHDSLFAVQHHQPFSFAYPGYITIRRFADLAAARLTGARHAVDLGCGPGEITCELARRFPETTFTGVDHSGGAIARARTHAEALNLDNVRFEVADVASYRANPPADIILMFDAFHHLLDPAGFVRRNAEQTRRFLLIEPAGDWLGGWQKTLELDWIPLALETIRARLVWQVMALHGTPATGTAPASAQAPRGDPVEHRYPLSDFELFFDGFGLDVRGTIAGLDVYPPDPYGHLPLREEFGRIAYETLAAVEDVLLRHDLDLLAKHWAIYAERGAPSRIRTPPPVVELQSAPPMRIEGAHDVEFIACDVPRSAAAGSTLLATVKLRNRGWKTWTSHDGGAVFLSYHWLDATGALAIEDGLRTPLPHAVPANSESVMTCRIETPPGAGRYTLALDLVEEGVTWFSRAGAPVFKVPMTITGNVMKSS